VTTPPRNPRRLTALGAAALLGLAMTTLGVAAVGVRPASAAGVGYVRLAHLSPDTPAVDVYLASLSGAIEPKKFPAVGYGVMSQYLPLPPGGYAVAMRAVGAPADSAPSLTTQASVEAGKAYTVAGVGRHADLGLRVLVDDLMLPPKDKAKCRVIQASIREPVLDVSVAGGRSLASGVPFATTTDYWAVEPGAWKLQLKGGAAGAPTTVNLSLAAGGVYSVLVLDGKVAGLAVEVRTDAKGDSSAPNGGVNTGGGGTAPTPHAGVAPALGAALLLATAILLGLSVRRRRPSRVQPSVPILVDGRR
jgi:hypothetical protein